MVVSRPYSAIRNSATQHFHYAQRLRLVRGYGAISADMLGAGSRVAGLRSRTDQIVLEAPRPEDLPGRERESQTRVAEMRYRSQIWSSSGPA